MALAARSIGMRHGRPAQSRPRGSALARKGVVFTLMAIVLAAVLLLTSALMPKHQTPQDTAPELERIAIVDRTLDAFESYAENALRISCYAAMDRLAVAVANDTAQGEHVDQKKERWFASQAALRNNISGCMFRPPAQNIVRVKTDSIPVPCLQQLSIPVLLDNFTSLVQQNLDVDIKYSFDESSFSVVEVEPFVLQLNVSMAVNVSDLFANWTVQAKNYSLRISLEGVTDPLVEKFRRDANYTTSSLRSYNFSKTPTKETEWNNLSFVLFVGNQTYRHAPEAPSILGRYSGNLSPSPCCGVETMLVKEQLQTGSGKGFELWKNYSFVDHELFRIGPSGHSPSLFHCSNPPTDLQNYGLKMPIGLQKERFLLNASVYGRYNVSGLSWDSYCS